MNSTTNINHLFHSNCTIMSEIIWVHIGQTGIQIGLQFWDLIMAEHGVGYDGHLQYPKGNPHVMFDEDENGLFIPRAVFIDTDDIAIEEAMKSDLGQLMKPDQFVYGKEPANNFSRGHYTTGREIIDRWLDATMKFVKKCTNIDSILLFHSMSGGTGTGVGSLLFERLNVVIPKVVKVSINVLPSEDNSSLIIEPYNFTLGFHGFLEHIDYSLWYDNQSLYKIWENKLKIEAPTFSDINKLIAKHVSSTFCSIRFSNEDMSEDSSSILQNEISILNSKRIVASIVPYPRIHFLNTSFSPYIAEIDSHKIDHSVEVISESVLNPDSYLVSFDNKASKSLGSILSYRGDVWYSEIMKTLPDTRQKLRFVDYVPTGITCSLNNSPCVAFKEEAQFQRSVSLLNTLFFNLRNFIIFWAKIKFKMFNL